MNKKLIKQCDKIADMFLCYATEWKAMARSLERTTDKKKIDNVKNFIKKRGLYFDNIMKGGFK